MNPVRVTTALLTTATLTLLLAACGSDSGSDKSSGGGADGKAGSGASIPAALADSGGDGGGGGIDGPCDVTDRATVASVFPGASDGKPGNVRNCQYTFAGGKINIFLFDGDLDAYKKQAASADISFAPAPVGDAAIRDQLHTLTVQQGDVLFAVQALGSSVQESELAKFDTRTLALARKIAAGL